jgi:hypothetical protein
VLQSNGSICDKLGPQSIIFVRARACGWGEVPFTCIPAV